MQELAALAYYVVTITKFGVACSSKFWKHSNHGFVRRSIEFTNTPMHPLIEPFHLLKFCYLHKTSSSTGISWQAVVEFVSVCTELN